MTTIISQQSNSESMLVKTLRGGVLTALFAGFFTLLMTAGTIGTDGLTPTSAAAQQGYEEIKPAQNTTDQENVEVLEFFWFGCPHCFAFEPSIDDWAANIPENTVFIREAPPLNPSWETHSQAFYASEILGISEKFVPAMFNAIHKEKKRMRKPSDIAKLAATFGVEEKAFTDAMKSFGVQTRMNRAMQLARGAGITGVPSLTVNGKYRISSGSAGSHEGMIAAINQTVATEKKAMGLE